MKKHLLFFAMMVLCVLSASGQLLVDSLGNVCVRTNTSVAKSPLSINSIGDASYDVYVRSNKTNTQPNGNVTIKSGAELNINAKGKTIINKGVVIEKGAKVYIK